MAPHEYATWVLIILGQNTHYLDNRLEYPFLFLFLDIKLVVDTMTSATDSIISYLPYRVCKDRGLDANLKSASLVVRGKIWCTVMV
jgi:hypothetical protein